MAVLYSNDFEASTHLATLAAFTPLGGSSAFIVIDQGSFPAMPAARGVKSYAQNGSAERNFWNGGSAIGDQGMRSASKLIAGHYMGHMLRVDSAVADRGYWFYYTLAAGVLTAFIVVRDGGEIASVSGGSVAAVAGDVVHMESLAIGNDLSVRLWVNGASRPATPTLSWTRTNYATGRQGLIKIGSTGTYASADDLVIADGAGGLDLFYPASDTTPPALTSPTGAGGLGVCSGTVSTNEANGTLYAVATASATAPTAAQVKAGQDHTGTAALRVVSQAVTATGTQTVASGAISGGAGTRYLHYMHEDAAANQSAVASSAGFTVTVAATSMTIALKQSDGTTAAASVTGIEYVILNAATLAAATAILDTGTGESTDGSGNMVLDITGLGLTPGNVRYVIAGKSNGTVGADFDGWQGPATAA